MPCMLNKREEEEFVSVGVSVLVLNLEFVCYCESAGWLFEGAITCELGVCVCVHMLK